MRQSYCSIASCRAIVSNQIASSLALSDAYTVMCPWTARRGHADRSASEIGRLVNHYNSTSTKSNLCEGVLNSVLASVITVFMTANMSIVRVFFRRC